MSEVRLSTVSSPILVLLKATASSLTVNLGYSTATSHGAYLCAALVKLE